jgi:uncharacterized protein YndB with AHSA1/START domain
MSDTATALDLHFQRTVPLEPGDIWRCWTRPEHLMPWFCPLPWKTVECDIDLRIGGTFRTVMQSPDGGRFPNLGIYLDIVPNRRLVWTNALEPGFRPAMALADNACGAFAMTAIIELTAVDGGTLYNARVLHANLSGKQQHEAMGFEQGWGQALEQMVAYIKSGGLN